MRIALLTLGLLAAWPVQAASRIEKELPLASGGQLSLDTDAGSVTVRGTPRSGARIVVTSPKDDVESDYTFDFQESPGGVTVTARRKGGEKYGIFSWLMSGRSPSLSWEIEVPRETAITIDTAGGAIRAEGLAGMARLDTSGGSIAVADVAGAVSADTSGGSITIGQVAGDVTADTSGGSISVDSIRGTARLDTSGGSIKAHAVTGDLKADTSGGSISISEAGGRVDADTSGGPVDVAFVRGNQRGGSISSSGGGVRVAIDPAANLEIDASASGGSVQTELELTMKGEVSRSELRGRLGAGGERLHLEASGGSIQIAGL